MIFSDELKRSTATAHLGLERRIIPHLKKIRSKDDYIRFLDYLHSFYDALDQRLQPWFSEPGRVSDAARIRQDIRQLDPGFEFTVRESVEVPQVDSYERALGVMYVLEGSTLGGQIISGMLTKQLGDISNAYTYYNPYGESTFEKWNHFKEKLNQPFTPEQQQEMIAAANETFKTLNTWMADYGSIEA